MSEKTVLGVVSVNLMLSAMLGGCGTMSVSVDVLDPRYVNEKADQVTERKVFLAIERAKPGEAAKRLDRSFQSFAEEVRKQADSIRQLAIKLPVKKMKRNQY